MNIQQTDSNCNSGIIVIDAVVGAGKTTYMNILSESLNLKYFEEPVDENPILDKFYQNRKRYGFASQVFFLNKRIKMLKEANSLNEKVLMDRSIYGDAIFAKLLKLEGNMENEEYSLYLDLLDNMIDNVKSPKLMIYLKIDTDSAIERIKLRGRDFEQTVEREYWENLNKEYELYFSNYELSPLLVIDAAKYDIVDNLQDRNEIITLIKNKLQELDNIK